MAYSVKEIYLPLHGEGRHTGRPAVLCRFAGCNLWSGREADRADAQCRFCDTDFVGTDGPGGGVFERAETLAQAVAAIWPHNGARPFVVCTGGEPLLQLDGPLIEALHAEGFEVAVETNGTLAVPDAIDWVTVSPKAGTGLAQVTGDELKLVYPQADAEPHAFEGLDFNHFMLQPMDGDKQAENTRKALAYCLAHPRWRLSLQTHKIMGIP